jgi:hypothetical protein
VKVIDATGNGNLLPKYRTAFIEILKDEQSEKIFILTDLDVDDCITKTKERIGYYRDTIILVSVKQVEAWFLADTITLSKIFKEPDFHFDFPEKEINPFETLRNLYLQKTNRGLGNSKPKIARQMVAEGFTIANAANLPNVGFARYFVNKLNSIHL